MNDGRNTRAFPVHCTGMARAPKIFKIEKLLIVTFLIVFINFNTVSFKLVLQNNFFTHIYKTKAFKVF